MAHFAELDANNVVLRVIVVGNADTSDANGVEKERIGAAFCERLFGGTWKQTSYNGNIRKNYAGIGYTYREDIDAFVPPQPYPSWILNDKAQWEAPTPMPQDGQYTWNEATQSWEVDVVIEVPSASPVIEMATASPSVGVTNV
jgi:hypothetical protein